MAYTKNVEDSLKSTRNIYTLLLAASSILLITSISIVVPEYEKIDEEIRRITSFDEYRAYVVEKERRYIENEVDDVVKQIVSNDRDHLEEHIKTLLVRLIKSTGFLAEYYTDIHVGTMKNTRLQELEQISRPLEMPMFKIEEWNGIIYSLQSLFSDEVLFGEGSGLYFTLRVERRIGTSMHDVIVSAQFGDQITIPETDLRYAAQQELVDIDSSSYMNWLTTQNLVVVVELESGDTEVRLRSLSDSTEDLLERFGKEYRKTKLKRLSELWKFQKGRAALQEHTFAFLQTGLTGVTFLYVVGIGVLFISCYLCFHFHHLHNVTQDNVFYLKHYAFMPTSLPKEIWFVELLFRVLVVPVLALLGTTTKFPPFQSQWMSWSLFALMAMVFLFVALLDYVCVRGTRRWLPDTFVLGRDHRTAVSAGGRRRRRR